MDDEWRPARCRARQRPGVRRERVFTAGLVLFEVPTGVIADIRGRRLSYLLGTLTLAVSTVLYLLMWRISAPFWAWAAAFALLGLGFTFFSGAVEAWLVDALKSSGFKGQLDSVFARGEILEGTMSSFVPVSPTPVSPCISRKVL